MPRQKAKINLHPDLRFRLESRESIFRYFSEHSEADYPCASCQYPDHELGAVECAHKACVKWRDWFNSEWNTVRDSLYNKLKK